MDEPKPFTPLTVKELKGILGTLDPDRIVVMSRDSEGNDFQMLHQIDPGTDGVSFGFDPGREWLGEIVIEGDTTSKQTVRPCIVLWPLN